MKLSQTALTPNNSCESIVLYKLAAAMNFLLTLLANCRSQTLTELENRNTDSTFSPSRPEVNKGSLVVELKWHLWCLV